MKLNRVCKRIAACMVAAAIMICAVPTSSVWATTDDSNDIGQSKKENQTNGTAKVETADPSIVTTNAISDWPQAPDILEETGVLMDTTTGTVLYNKMMDQRMFPASTTKIMTALLALENSSLDDQVVFTETGVKDAYAGSSNIGMQVGETLTMEQCLYTMMLKSANEVTTQVAEYVGGSVEDFINMMNQKAKDLGCTGTHFNNANGLPDDNHYTTPHDMALIGQAAIQNETFRKIIGTEVYTLEPTNKNPNARSFDNHHAMIHEGDWYYEGCLGGKTGYTDAAQSTLVTFAEREGMLLVCVLMKGDGTQIVKDTKTILDYGFDNFILEDLQQVGEVLQGGKVIVPENSKIESLEVSEEIQQDAVLWTYSFSGYKVGSVSITKQSYEQIKEHEKQEKIKKEEEEKNARIKAAAEKKEKKTQDTMKLIIFVLGILILLALVLVIIKVILNKKK